MGSVSPHVHDFDAPPRPHTPLSTCPRPMLLKNKTSYLGFPNRLYGARADRIFFKLPETNIFFNSSWRWKSSNQSRSGYVIDPPKSRLLITRSTVAPPTFEANSNIFSSERGKYIRWGCKWALLLLVGLWSPGSRGSEFFLRVYTTKYRLKVDWLPSSERSKLNSVPWTDWFLGTATKYPCNTLKAMPHENSRTPTVVRSTSLNFKHKTQTSWDQRQNVILIWKLPKGQKNG